MSKKKFSDELGDLADAKRARDRAAKQKKLEGQEDLPGLGAVIDVEAEDVTPEPGTGLIKDKVRSKSQTTNPPRKKLKTQGRQFDLAEVGVENPICQKCAMFSKAVSPFMLPSYWSVEKDKWLLGWPAADKQNEVRKEWIVIMGEIPGMEADASGDIRKDRNFGWLMDFGDLYPELRERIIYVPSMMCRPNDPGDREAKPCINIVKLSRTIAYKCGRSHLLPRINRDFKIDRIVGIGWLGSLVTVNNMGIEHVARKIYRDKDYKWLAMPIRGMEYLSFDPTSALRQNTLYDDWDWSLTFDTKRSITCPWEWVVTAERLEEWLAPLLEREEAIRILYLDVETSGVDVFKKDFMIGMFSFYFEKSKTTAIVPLIIKAAPALYAEITGNDVGGWPEERTKIMRVLKRIIIDPKILKIGHNLSYDINAIRCFLKWRMQGIFNDTMYLHYLTDPDANGMKGLDELVREYLPEVPDYWSDMDEYREKHNIDNYLKLPARMLGEYAAFDTYLLPKLFKKILRKINDLPGGEFVTSTGSQQSIPRIIYALHGRTQHLRLCTHLDFTGQRVDAEMAAQVKIILVKKVAKLRADLANMPTVREFEENQLGLIAGKSSPAYKAARMGLKPDINWGSLAQIKALLIDYCGLPVVKRTETGNVCLDEGVLNEYVADYANVAGGQVCTQLLKVRESEKFITSFLDPLILDKKLVIRDDGLVHASFRGAAISTGRLSAARPNITAISRDGPIKHLYRPHWDGGWLVTRDYSGIEVRIMACLSRCPALLKVLRDGVDVHFNTQKHFFGDKANAKDKTQRSICKQTLFGNIYGQGDQGLFDLLKAAGVISPKTGLAITIEECHEFNQLLYDAYPGIGMWIQQAHVYGIVNQCTGSGFGFVRRLQALGSWDFSRKVKSCMDYDEIRAHPDYRRLTSSVSKDLRRAQNAPIQSTAGDLTTFAALRIQERMEEEGITQERAKVCSVIHDDIWNSVRYAEDCPRVLQIMEDVMDRPWEWLPKALPGFDPSWLKLVPIFGECELGVSPKDVMPGKMNDGILEVEIDKLDFTEFALSESKIITEREIDDGKKKVVKVTVDFLDVADFIRPLLEERRQLKLLNLA